MRWRTLIVTTLLLPAALAAQPSGSHASPSDSTPDGVMFAFQRFADIFSGRLVAAFDAIPADRYAYRPTPAQQSVGYIAQHLEDANYSLCERFGSLKHATTAKDSLADTVKARWPKETLVARLRASVRFCDAALQQVAHLQSPALATSLLAFETDLAEHYSQIATYMRLLGLVPPSAIPPRARTAIVLPAAELSRYVGVYRLAPGLDLDIVLRDGSLFATSTAGGTPVQLWPEHDTTFFVRGVDAQVTFSRDAAGAVTGLMLHQYGRDRPATRIR